MDEIRIGIFGSSTQSGTSFTADLIDHGYIVYGYSRPSGHGKKFVDTVRDQCGIYLERPQSVDTEESRFVEIDYPNTVGHDIQRLVDTSDLIVLAHPSIYQVETTRKLRDATDILSRKVPLVLSPGRSFASPYIWNELGENYPLVVFSTCPYSCKSLEPGRSYIKRRKRNWVGSLEGDIADETLEMIRTIWPQVLFNRIPGTTTLNNIGAIFHPTPYILAWDEIKKSERDGKNISYYIKLIVERPGVGRIIEEIDQMRLGIAHAVGLPTFGYNPNPREEEWMDMMNHLRESEDEYDDGLDGLRSLRTQKLRTISKAVVASPHWLDYTYGVERIPGEHLSETIGRTPTYQKRSVPQRRYVEEDVPASLVPLEEAAVKFGVPHKTASEIIDLYGEKINKDPRVSKSARNLEEFDVKYLREYLTGELFKEDVI